MKKLTDYVVFNDRTLAKRYANSPIPMSVLYEAYFDGAIDIPGNLYELLDERNRFVKYTLTPEHAKWAVTNFLPEVTIHSKSQDKRIVREHYDRGNDFFGWFLGERMVYTSGYFTDPNQTVEEAQDNKMHLVCQKLRLKPGERLLDIGCGWGTLARHAAKYYGVDATGVTISENQTEFGNRRIREWGLEDRARILCCDYRDIPYQKFDKIVSLEMVEHVGVKNLKKFYSWVSELLKDDGLFLLQWTGLRRELSGETLIWGLFMNKYIFPGADASLPPAGMLKPAEEVGWETFTVENVSQHYGWTIRRWHDYWMSNEQSIKAVYGERWYRIWHFFLGWSVCIAGQGNASCYQVVFNKNLDGFDRTQHILDKGVVHGARETNIQAPRTTPGNGAFAAE
ncbi:MAG TPA: cyclopropane-fatty-acyl-phospholipid synthase family protein [Polyangiaceae bacterium]|nr:cyclopropane-fatty-acyl-phospholipid synthase family protein [Polyangiaceae bacterium]